MKIIKPVYAGITPIPIGDLCGGEGLGPFAKFLCNLQPGDQNNAVKTIGAFAYLISNVIGILSVVAGIIFIFQFLIAGINWLTSGGDKEKVSKAQQAITNSLIGLIIVLAAFAFISLISKILGFDLLISDPTGFVGRIRR